MKHNCVISRLKEPNIARRYMIEFDQNLINNIRVLCTKYPETVKYFVPEELFLALRNGYPVPLVAKCYDKKAGRLLPIDPLKVLSEQLREAPGVIPAPQDVEIWLYVKGYALPDVGDTTGFIPKEYRGNLGTRIREEKPGTSYTTYTYTAPRRPPKRSTIITAVIAAVLILAAAGVWLMKDVSVRHFGEAMNAAKYSEAVLFYNERILGHPSMEATADPQIEEAVSMIEAGYLSQTKGYEEARRGLSVLTGVRKEELAQMAQDALDTIDAYESAAATYNEGLEAMKNGDYVGAIGAFREVLEAPGNRDDAQAQFDLCVDRIVKAAAGIASEEEYPDAAAKIEAALEILPDDTRLTEGRDACQSKYRQLVVTGAITAADERIAEGDFAGAFALIEEGQGKIIAAQAAQEQQASAQAPESEEAQIEASEPEEAQGEVSESEEAQSEASEAAQVKPARDSKLELKAEEYRRGFVCFVTRGVCAKVDEGDWDEARALIGESQEIRECGEFEALRDQVDDAEDRSSARVRTYIADKAAEMQKKGTIKKKGQVVRYTFKAAESGPHRFLLSKIAKGLKAQMAILAPDGSELWRSAAVTAGCGTTCSLEKGKTYSVEVLGVEGKGTYYYTVRQQKAVRDISSYDVVSDRMEFPGQKIAYTFDAGQSGNYRLDLVDVSSDLSLNIGIYDPMGSKVASEKLSDGDGMTFRLDPGSGCEIRVAQVGGESGSDQDGSGSGVASSGDGDAGDSGSGSGSSQSGGLGEYTLRLSRPSASEDITGKNIIAGEITYKDQRNTYKFTAPGDGNYRVTLGNMPDGCRFRLYLYDSLGYKVGGDDSLESGDAVTVELAGGQAYEIQLTQGRETGGYTLTLCEEE